MEFAEAVRIVEKAQKEPKNLTFEEGMSFGLASSILAFEYIKVRDRIAPA